MNDPDLISRRTRWPDYLVWLRPWLPGLLAVIVGGLLFAALHDLTREFNYNAMAAAIRNTGHSQIALAILCMAISYLTLTGYDHSALRYAGARVPYGIVGQTAFVAYALGNTIGLGMLTGGAVRMRMYSAAGVEAGRITRAIGFNAAAFGLGITVVGAAALLWAAAAVAPVLQLSALLLRIIAVAVLLATGALLWMCRGGRERKLFGWLPVRLPTLPLALEQLAISAIDIAASAAVLWVLLPDGTIGFPAFLGFYSLATVLGVVSHVPGGLGVLEAIMLLALKNRAPTETVAGALILYRLIYYVLPLALALVLLVAHELKRGIATAAGRAAISLAPTVLAGYTLIVGAMLLLSGVTPATDEAADLLALHVPLPLIEASHFLGSIAGLILLFVARGMLLRLDAAWWVGVIVAGISAVLALPKGIAVSEAAALTLLTLALISSHQQFTRRTSLLAQPLGAGWLVCVGVILAVVTGVLFISYRDVEYAHELWWQFEFDGHAPRSLRALVAVGVLALMFALRQLLRPPPAPLTLPDAVTLERAAAIVREQDPADAGLALTADKYLLFSGSGNAFIMFGRRGRSWISLFDPVGPQHEWPALVWNFLERAREQGGRAAFYQVPPQTLPLYIDAGLRVFKLGEYAHVVLNEFSLKGSRRAALRQGVNRGERDGLTFELIPVASVPALLPQIRIISDAWLDEQQTAEKGFSLGAFRDDYIRRHPIAIVRHASRLVAFATLLDTARRTEASVDLMRHLPDAPRSVMEFLFTKLLLHFQAQGFQRFGLGMAPLSGMAEHPLAPGWHRMGRLLFSHGEHFYNFQGLRAFKEKFDPVWEARYLAASGGATSLMVLTDIAALIGGGLRGVIAK